METLISISAEEAPILVSPESIESETVQDLVAFDPEELAFEIGAWLSGIRSFASTCQPTFAGDNRNAVPDLRREFRILTLALMRLSRLTLRFHHADAESMLRQLGISRRQLDDFSFIIRDSVTLVDSHSRAAKVSIAEWQAFVSSLINRLDSDPADERLRRYSIGGAFDTLPMNLRALFERDDIELEDRVDYLDVVPRVAAALRYLGIVGRMMRDDEPIKPALLILAAVHDQARGMIDHINLRLARNPNEEATLFNSLDSASYGASLELKKVFQQELRGIVGVLPPTSVFARTETAYSLLLDSFQQILLDLARTIDPKATLFDFFPRFQVKLDQ